jgi:hypothetical protein
MKAINNDTVAPKTFQPIAVTILIETKEEYDAIMEAKRNLSPCEIDYGYDEDHRAVWVDLIDCIADDMRRKSC